MTLFLIALIIFFIIWGVQSSNRKKADEEKKSSTRTNVQLQKSLGSESAKLIDKELSVCVYDQSPWEFVSSLYKKYNIPDPLYDVNSFMYNIKQYHLSKKDFEENNRYHQDHLHEAEDERVAAYVAVRNISYLTPKNLDLLLPYFKKGDPGKFYRSEFYYTFDFKTIETNYFDKLDNNELKRRYDIYFDKISNITDKNHYRYFWNTIFYSNSLKLYTDTVWEFDKGWFDQNNRVSNGLDLDLRVKEFIYWFGEDCPPLPLLPPKKLYIPNRTMYDNIYYPRLEGSKYFYKKESDDNRWIFEPDFDSCSLGYDYRELRNYVSDLMDAMTKKDLYSLGLKPSPDGIHDSDWQEREKRIKEFQEYKQKYPWDV